jgi:hypothetical protein
MLEAQSLRQRKRKRLQYILPLLPSERSGKLTPFSQLVRTWEAYINDDEGDVFQPLQMLQSLQLCSRAVKGWRVLRVHPFRNERVGTLTLQHTSSSPLRYRPPMFDYNDEEVIPPVPLNPPTVELNAFSLSRRIVSRAPLELQTGVPLRYPRGGRTTRRWVKPHFFGFCPVG